MAASRRARHIPRDGGRAVRGAKLFLSAAAAAAAAASAAAANTHGLAVGHAQLPPARHAVCAGRTAQGRHQDQLRRPLLQQQIGASGREQRQPVVAISVALVLEGPARAGLGGDEVTAPRRRRPGRQRAALIVCLGGANAARPAPVSARARGRWLPLLAATARRRQRVMASERGGATRSRRSTGRRRPGGGAGSRRRGGERCADDDSARGVERGGSHTGARARRISPQDRRGARGASAAGPAKWRRRQLRRHGWLACGWREFGGRGTTGEPAAQW